MQFEKTLLYIIQDINCGIKEIDEKIEKLKEYYGKINDYEKEGRLKNLYNILDQNMDFYIFLLSFLFNYLNDEVIETCIEDVLEGGNIGLAKNIVFARQIRTKQFLVKTDCDEEKAYKKNMRIHKKHIEELQKLLLKNYSYIPYEARNSKRVILMIEPILNEDHAPTKKMINLYSYFQKLGYEVLVIATNYNKLEIECGALWWDLIADNYLYDETGTFSREMLGVMIKGVHIMYGEKDFIINMKLGMDIVKEFNPEFILTVGDENLLADLCSEFTTVATMPCVNKPAITVSPIVVNYFIWTERQKQLYQKCLSNKKILEFRHIQELGGGSKEKLTREQFGMKEQDFVIIIAGNRLNMEITEEVKQILFQILDENEKVIIAFIGKCESLREKMDKTDYSERFRYLGYQNNFKGAIGLGDIFLNPPRQGGGSGGSNAMQEGVPVITLDNCDMAMVGEAFICKSLEDMPKLVKKYITDAEFMQRQKKLCELSAKKRVFGINDVENLEKLCTEIKNEIIKREQRQEEMEEEGAI